MLTDDDDELSAEPDPIVTLLDRLETERHLDRTAWARILGDIAQITADGGPFGTRAAVMYLRTALRDYPRKQGTTP